MLKNIFLEVKNKFETALGILRKEKITIDPDDEAAVAHYAKVMKTVREKLVPFLQSSASTVTLFVFASIRSCTSIFLCALISYFFCCSLLR